MTEATADQASGGADSAGAVAQYTMRISRLTVDKLGVKLYDKVSAVVAELVANSYDADAETVRIVVPLGTELATKVPGAHPSDKGFKITVRDDGHGMTPAEAQAYFLRVGTDRRVRDVDGAKSRLKQRHVMGRKGIGKLAPFGICRRIEVVSSGGDETPDGYLTSHFILDFEKILRDEDSPVPVEAGDRDRTFQPTKGTEVTLSQFLSKRVPAKETFIRQLARRFALSAQDFAIVIEDTRGGGEPITIPKFEIALNETTKISIDDRPVILEGVELPVSGWLAFAKESYRDEEEAGVRIYARGKIVATTRDFEQPAGFTGEFATRSYLVGEVHAEWLDADEDDDLVRTDRQGILWDSEKGDALRQWGMTLIKEIARLAAGPRREKKRSEFLQRSRLVERARELYGDDATVIDAVSRLGARIGEFASEDELRDDEYVQGLAEIVLSVAPHQALIEAFRKISGQEDKTLEDLVALFGKTRLAEMASYAQIASERVASIKQLEAVVDDKATRESDLQELIARAPWLIQPDWSVITENERLTTFRDRFVRFYKQRHGEDLDIAVSYETKRPDFTLIHVGRKLHIVELKKPGHDFADADYSRLENYIVAFEDFFAANANVASEFPDGWQVDLIADGVRISGQTAQRAFDAELERERVVRQTWEDFLQHAVTTHEEFLRAHRRGAASDS